MLQQVLECIHNWFIVTPNPGRYSISNGTISPLIALLEGQRFRIVGSVLNDGLYTYHEAGIMDGDDKSAANLTDETFGGTICALAVPREVISLADEISDWLGKYGDTITGPYTSESFGGYSYTKASGAGTGTNAVYGWQTQFAGRLNQWRKLC